MSTIVNFVLGISDNKFWHRAHWKNSQKISEILYDNVWVFGDLICKLGTFMTMINFYGSTIFLMAISVDRFLAIVYPLKVSSKILHLFYIMISYTDEVTFWPSEYEVDLYIKLCYGIWSILYGCWPWQTWLY